MEYIIIDQNVYMFIDGRIDIDLKIMLFYTYEVLFLL